MKQKAKPSQPSAMEIKEAFQKLSEGAGAVLALGCVSAHVHRLLLEIASEVWMDSRANYDAAGVIKWQFTHAAETLAERKAQAM